MAVDTARSPHDHSVQFYQSDLFLADVVATFLEEGFHAGDVALVIATPQHQALFCAQLASRGLDVAALLRHQRLVMLDATEAVRRIVDHGRVDEAAFHEFVGPSLQALATHAAGANVRAYGEIVDLLWGAGERSAAIRLEELWNALRERHRFSLLCAYLMDSFVKHHGIGDVCATHTHVHTPEKVADGPIDVLDARSLVHEIAHRRELELALRESMTQLRAAEEQTRAAKDDLEQFLAGAVVPIHRVDRAGIIRWANEAELELLGYAPEEYIGQPIARFHADSDVIADILARLKRGETLRDAKSTLIAKDGSLRHVEISSNVQMLGGEFLSTRCFTRDVTELRRSEHRAEVLHRLTAALATALSVEDAALVVIRETRDVLGASAGALLLLDPTRKSIERVVSDERAFPHLYQDLQLDSMLPLCEAARTGTLIWLVGADAIDARYPHLAHIRSHSNALTWGAVPIIFEGRALGSIAFRLDREHFLSTEEHQLLFAIGRQCAQAIERARLHDATDAARNAAETANRAKDDFLAMLGHELRNPLSPILTAVQLMKLKGDGTWGREYGIIERQVKHLTRLVDDLLDVSRVARDKVQLDRRPVTLAPLIRKAVESIAPLCEERHHQLTVSLPPGDIWLDADETRLTQILTNLIGNAAKYTPANGTITVAVSLAGPRVRIAIADNGVGIEPALLPRIFDLFVQGAQSSDRKQGGLGIGLAIVQQLVAMHGGEVRAYSPGVGRGSEFVVELPTLQLDAVRRPERDSNLRNRLTVTPRRILVVDDNEDAAMLLGETLRSVGHEVLVVNDGPRAIELSARFSPEVAILDLGLPIMDGFELAKALREQFHPTPIRLLALTGYGQDQDRARASEAGFETHLTKPVALAKILAAIERP